MSSYERLHLVYNDEGKYGWSLTCPQLPGLIYGRADYDAFEAGIPEVLEAFDAPALPHQLHFAARNLGTTTGIGYRIRVAMGSPLRYRVASQLVGAINVPEQEPALLSRAAANPTGEAEFIIALGTDRLGWIYDQILPTDGVVALIGYIDNGHIWNDFVSKNSDNPGMVDLEMLGLTMDNTVDDARNRKRLMDELGDAIAPKNTSPASTVQVDQRVLVLA